MATLYGCVSEAQAKDSPGHQIVSRTIIERRGARHCAWLMRGWALALSELMSRTSLPYASSICAVGMPLRVADVAQNARTEAGRGEAQKTQGAHAWSCIDGSAETQHFSDGGALGRRSSDARRALRRLGA